MTLPPDVCRETLEPADFNEAFAPDTQQLLLLLEYDGRAFHGSQAMAKRGERPPHAPHMTVQEAVWHAIHWLQADAWVHRCLLASRTDAGVHALSQVVQLSVSPQFFERYRDARLQLNAAFKRLGYVLMVRAMERIPTADFHIRNRTKWRWYRYQWYLAPGVSPLMPINATPRHHGLCLQTMQAVAQLCVGTHNFKAFQSVNTTPVQETVCTIASIEISQPQHALITMDVIGNRFLYRMVRNLAGAFEQVACERNPRLHLEDVRRMLRQHDCNTARTTAPSSGLTLMSLLYPLDTSSGSDTQVLFQTDPWVQSLQTRLLHSHGVLQDNENLFR
ncbi:MAG: hypothetical protein ACKO34_08265 [Vampirovibrionales bacterium]